MGAWQEIVDYTVPSNTTQVDFTGLNITKDDFIRVVTTINNTSSGAGTIGIFPNNDTNDNNYYRQLIRAFGGEFNASRVNQFRFGLIGPNKIGNINGYLKISKNNKLNVFGNYNDNNGSSVENNFSYTTSTSSFTSITSLSLKSNQTNGLGANSRIQIYKLAAEKVADITVASNTTQVDITGLDIKKGDEYLLVSDIAYSGGSTPVYWLMVNNNLTKTNYYNQEIRGEASTASAARQNAPLFASLNATNAQRTLIYTHIKLSNIGAYTSQSYAMRSIGSNIVGIQNRFISSTFENLTSINQLNIETQLSNGISPNTRFQLYKLYEGGN